MSSHRFLVVTSLEFSIIMSSYNSNGFTSSLFFFFSLSEYCMARTFNIMLNKSGEDRHPCLVSDLKGNAFSFSFHMMLVVGLSYMSFIMLRYSCLGNHMERGVWWISVHRVTKNWTRLK